MYTCYLCQSKFKKLPPGEKCTKCGAYVYYQFEKEDKLASDPAEFRNLYGFKPVEVINKGVYKK